MRKNCNLELDLFPPYDDSDYHHGHHHNQSMLEEVGDSPTQKHQGQRWQRQQEEQQHHLHQPLTIFYAGKICVSDVTELQAKSILMLANKKVEEKGIMRTPTTTSPVPSSPAIVQSSNNNNNNNHNHNNQLNNGTGTGLSMKRSLQRFLQKRKTRIQEASPYHQSL